MKKREMYAKDAINQSNTSKLLSKIENFWLDGGIVICSLQKNENVDEEIETIKKIDGELS